MDKLWISHQRARSFGPLAYRQAKRGQYMIVTWGGQVFWLGHVTPQGFYLVPYKKIA